MKLIIQIPCYNEEETLPHTIDQLPRDIPGIDCVEFLVVDDGSTDNTVRVARSLGVDHIKSHPKNQGLAKAFMTGLRTCLQLNADIIVNTDADNQYDASYIVDLIGPIIEKKAEIVIGARQIDEIREFSKLKRFLQKLGSWTIRRVSKTDIPDAPSGFRAISKNAALKINVFNNYTYTLEMIIQAGQKDIPITWVKVKTNPPLRPSRLIKNIPLYVYRSIVTIVRIFVVYKPFRFFMSIGLFLMFFGVLIGVRYLYYYFSGSGGGHIQSLILSSIILGMGFQTIMVAFISDLLSVNRKLLEELRINTRKSGLNQNDNSMIKESDK